MGKTLDKILKAVEFPKIENSQEIEECFLNYRTIEERKTPEKTEEQLKNQFYRGVLKTHYSLNNGRTYQHHISGTGTGY